MRLHYLLVAVSLCLAGQASPPAAYGADETPLLRVMPAATNAVSIVRVDRILSSPRARAEQWAQDRSALLAGAGTVPPWAETLVMGSLIHPSVADEVWTVAATQLPAGVDLLQLAAHGDTTVQRLSGLPAVYTPRGNLAIEYPGRVAASLLPSFRQDVSRWVRDVQARKDVALSPYLQAAAASNDQILLAMDMADMIDPRRIEARLWADHELAEQPLLVPHVLLALNRLKGVRMTVNVEQMTQARLMLDFSEPVPSAVPALKPIILAALSDAGIALDSLEKADVSTDGNSVVLTTDLPDDELRLVLSLILTPRTLPDRPQSPEDVARSVAEPPLPALPAEPRTTPAGSRPSRVAAPTAVSSQKYFAAVSGAIDDLYRVSNKGTNPARTATWHDNFAAKIEHLDGEGVDPDLLAFGEEVASRFRALAASLRGAAIEVDTQQRSVTYQVHYDPGWASGGFWGQMGYKPPSANVTSNLAEVRQRQASAVSSWAKEREQVWQLIHAERMQVSRVMAERHGVKF